MRRLCYLIFLFFLCSGNAWAVLPAPPILYNVDLKIPQYFEQLYDNHNKLEIVTTNPNGNRVGTYGDVVIYYTGTEYKIYTCISSPSGKSWILVQTGTSATVSWGDIVGTLALQTDLQGELDLKANKSTTITASSPITGGGDLSANRTIGIQVANTGQNGYLSATDWNTFNNKENKTYAIKNSTSSETVSTNYKYYRCNGTGITLTMPAATGSGNYWHIKNISSEAVITISATNIDGASSQSVYVDSSLMVVDGATDKYEII